MNGQTDWQLVPLRIPAGWTVQINGFFDVDPAALTPEERMLFSEDLLLVVHEHRGVLIDVHWHDPTLEYRLSVFRAFKDKDLMRESFDQPLDQRATRSTGEAADAVNTWLDEWSDLFKEVPKLKCRR